jgi:hypothetical protein
MRVLAAAVETEMATRELTMAGAIGNTLAFLTARRGVLDGQNGNVVARAFAPDGEVNGPAVDEVAAICVDVVVTGCVLSSPPNHSLCTVTASLLEVTSMSRLLISIAQSGHTPLCSTFIACTLVG